MKKNLLLSALLFCASLAATAGEESGTGTRGGGEVITQEGQLVLRDLNESTNCTWVRGSERIVEHAGFKTLMKRLESMNWFLAQTLREKAATLTVCETESDLRKVPTEDLPGFTPYLTQEGTERIQIAIRWDDQIFVSMPWYRQMNEENQAYLWTHEVLHSFLGMKVPFRNTKLRSTVQAIRKATQDPPLLNVDQFLYQLDRNDIDTVTDAKQIEEHTDLKAYLLGGSDVPRDVLLYRIHQFKKIPYYYYRIQTEYAAFQAKLRQWVIDGNLEALRTLDTISIESAFVRESWRSFWYVILAKNKDQTALVQFLLNREQELRPKSDDLTCAAIAANQPAAVLLGLRHYPSTTRCDNHSLKDFALREGSFDVYATLVLETDLPASGLQHCAAGRWLSKLPVDRALPLLKKSSNINVDRCEVAPGMTYSGSYFGYLTFLRANALVGAWLQTQNAESLLARNAEVSFPQDSGDMYNRFNYIKLKGLNFLQVSALSGNRWIEGVIWQKLGGKVSPGDRPAQVWLEKFSYGLKETLTQTLDLEQIRLCSGDPLKCRLP